MPKKTGREATQFKPGKSGNPNGRPKGTYSSAFMAARRIVMEVFNEDPELLRRDLREKYQNAPAAYLLKIMAPLMPKDFLDSESINDTPPILFKIHKHIEDKKEINVTPKTKQESNK